MEERNLERNSQMIYITLRLGVQLRLRRRDRRHNSRWSVGWNEFSCTTVHRARNDALKQVAENIPNHFLAVTYQRAAPNTAALPMFGSHPGDVGGTDAQALQGHTWSPVTRQL